MRLKTIRIITALSVSMALLLAACSSAGRTDTAQAVAYSLPDSADYSTLSWSDAFKAAHTKFSREYAFSAWKGVDWDALYHRFLPRIEQAQSAGDGQAYYLALHEYVFSIPDGHVSLKATDTAMLTAVSRQMAGSGFGLVLAELDDLRVVAATEIRDTSRIFGLSITRD